MTDKPIFGGKTGEQLTDECAEKVAVKLSEALVLKRGIVPSEDVVLIARTAARGGAIRMLQALQELGMVAPAGWKL